MRFGVIYNKYINSLLRTFLKPFSRSIPERFKFPVHGTFTVKGNQVPPFRVSTNPTSWFSKKVFWDNVEGFEFNSVKIFCELAKDSKVFFDIGANIGYYSLLASAIRRQTLVYAFEPMPSAFTYLQENIRINRFTNIQPQQLALSDQKGRAAFYSILNEKFKNLPQLTGDGGLSQSQSGKRTKVTFDVAIDTLDQFVKDNLKGLKIDLIKLDTEANEHRVLSGSAMVLTEHRPVIQCEILKNQIETEMEAVLQPYGYFYYRATDKGLVRIQSFLKNETDFVDYYLVPKEKEQLIQNFIA